VKDISHQLNTQVDNLIKNSIMGTHWLIQQVFKLSQREESAAATINFDMSLLIYATYLLFFLIKVFSVG
jgi:hypothetical protein